VISGLGDAERIRGKVAAYPVQDILKIISQKGLRKIACFGNKQRVLGFLRKILDTTFHI